ncbi:MAG: hypothetical protein WCQ66_01560 [Sphaerochaetaceae bacterium]|jgi:hypothetical protein
MQDKGKTFGTMAANLIAYLRRLGYQKTITAYGYRLRHLEKMLPEGSETVFNHEAWETIITAVGENRIWAVTEPYRRSLLHTADALFELQMTGTVEIHHKSRRTMDGPDGLLPPEMASFLKALGGKCYQPHTIGGYRTHLAKFQESPLVRLFLESLVPVYSYENPCLFISQLLYSNNVQHYKRKIFGCSSSIRSSAPVFLATRVQG